MTKILVFSDSHRQTDTMADAIRTHTPDRVLHLGDHDADAHVLSRLFPDLPIQAVRGNCDFGSSTPETAELLIEDKKIIMTHGHRYGVKQGLTSLCNMGHFADADILLFGHTHIPHHEQIEKMHVINPGPANRSCALIQIENGEIAWEHLSL